MGNGMLIPACDSADVLRYVEIDSQIRDVKPYRLLVWNTGTSYPGEPRRTRIGVAFYRDGDSHAEPTVLSYYGLGQGGAIDSDKSLVEALACVSMKTGDTDEEFFADYSAKGLAWAESYECEALQIVPFEAEHVQCNPHPDSIPWLEWRTVDGCERLYLLESSEPLFRDLET